MDREIVEEMILGMAEIVYENHRLQRELEEAKVYEKKYNDIIKESMKQAAENQKALLEAIMAGAFDGGEKNGS